MPIDNEGEAILAHWAEVERVLNKAKAQLDTLTRKSEEARTLRAEIDRLIDEWASLWQRYRDLVDDAQERHQPALRDWPEPSN
jgi:hypothetical protein